LVLLGAQQPFLLQAVNDGIEGTGAQSIPVPGKFLNHAETKNRLLTCVVKDVEPDQPRVQTLIGGFAFHIEYRYRISIIM
jgi:hypothetical protein